MRRRDPVAIIGCGLMGAAIARCLARGGHRVLAWNRTFERAEALAGDGITPLREAAKAVGEASLVIVCTTSTETTLAALDPVEDWNATTLVNLTSGSPEDAVQVERWATERGAEYLDGAIKAYPRDIGLAETMLVYSGSPAAWSAHEETLIELGGGSFHLSEEVGAVNLVNLAVAGFYISALSAYVEAVSYVRDNGVPTVEMSRLTARALDMLRKTTEEAAGKIESGDHETDQAALAVFADGMRLNCATFEKAGQRGRIFAATKEILEVAEAAGLGGLDLCAQSKVIRRPVADPPTVGT